MNHRRWQTELSLALCEHFQGEVISADSRQLYRFMDIVISPPATPADSNARPTTFIDICNPDELLTVAEVRSAYAAIATIHAAQHVPFLVGGTAPICVQWSRVCASLKCPNPELVPKLKQSLVAQGASLFEQKGRSSLGRRDRWPQPARVLRALEIVMITGKSKVELKVPSHPIEFHHWAERNRSSSING